MWDIILWFIPRIFTVYFMIITFFSGVVCYFFLSRTLKAQYPTESKIAKYGGLLYMIAGPMLFFIVKLIF